MSYILIDKNNFYLNLQHLTQKLGSKEKLAIVLKDNAYGHGLSEMAALASSFGLQRAVVRHVHEARQIESFFAHVLVLCPDFDDIDPRFCYTVNDHTDIGHFPKNTKIHLKIDTGMHRNGIADALLETTLEAILKNDLQLFGVMTHFRSSDELSSELFWQMQCWKAVKKRVLAFSQKHGISKPLFHAANSAAILRLETCEDDFARSGIAAYGYHEMPQPFGAYDLRPVLSLWGEKLSTRSLPKGACVGYGGMGKVEETTVISNYDVGYGDGLLRYDGLGDLHAAHGEKIYGRTSMDNISIQSDAKRICVFDDAKAFAKHFGTISYDVLVKLSSTIKRVVI